MLVMKRMGTHLEAKRQASSVGLPIELTFLKSASITIAWSMFTSQ